MTAPAAPKKQLGTKAALGKLGRKPKLVAVGVGVGALVLLLLHHGSGAAGNSTAAQTDAQTKTNTDTSQDSASDYGYGNIANGGWSNGAEAGYPGPGSLGGPLTAIPDVPAAANSNSGGWPIDPDTGYPVGFGPSGATSGADPHAGDTPTAAAAPPSVTNIYVTPAPSPIKKPTNTAPKVTVPAKISGTFTPVKPKETPAPATPKASTPPAKPSPVTHNPQPTAPRVAPSPVKKAPANAYLTNPNKRG